MHITAGVFINDDEGGLHQDFEVWLEKLAPKKPHNQYKHNGYEDNIDAHMKSQILGREVVVAVTERKFDFGPGNRSFMENSMAKAGKECWSRSLEIDQIIPSST